MSKRRRRPARSFLAVIFTLAALALAGAWLWYAIQAPAKPSTPAPQVHEAEPGHAPPQAGEDLTASERQQLQDILKRKAAQP